MRRTGDGWMIYAFDAFEVDTRLYELRRDGETRPLEPQVFDVLAYLVHHRDRVVPKDELLEKLWPDRIVTESTLSSRVMAARKALGDDGRAQRFIRTVHGRGFRFVAETAERVQYASGRPFGAATSDQPPCPQPEERSAAAPARPVLAVGRETELETLADCLDESLAGERRVVFITGEAGLGKTTLVEAFLREIEEGGSLRVGHGQCLEHRGEGEAYMPVLDALGRICRGPGGSEVVRLLAERAPTWLVQMPGLVPSDEVESLQRRVQGATRERMLREMVEAVDALTATRPLVLVLEDLHWSDHSTVDLLAWLGKRREPARLLVIGTWRQADVRRDGHPLEGVARELVVRYGGREMPLAFLDESAVDQYLSMRCPGTELPEGLARLVHERTNGNPLFMVNVLEHWREQGLLVEEDGRCLARAGMEDLARGVPESLRLLIVQQVDGLGQEDREILEAASVVGNEFSAAAVAAGVRRDEDEVEERCEVLARQGQLLSPRGTDEWEDGTVAARYGFIHDLYGEVLYDRVPPGRRARLHRRIGERLETAYGEKAPERAAELAVHFVRGRDSERAVSWLENAARQAFGRSAHHEAREHLGTALEILRATPGGPERSRRELGILSGLAPAFIATSGWGIPEVEELFNRARDLADELGDVRYLSRAMHGLATMYEFRGEFPTVRALLDERLKLPGHDEDPMLVLESHELMACSLFHQGVFEDSIRHADISIGSMEAAGDCILGDATFLATGSHTWASLSLWCRGRPDAALARMQEAAELAGTGSNGFAMAWASYQAAVLHQFRREPDAVHARAEEAVMLAAQQGFPYVLASGSIMGGWARAMRDDPEGGIDLLRRGIEDCRATGAEMDHPYYLTLLAEALSVAGRPGEALQVLDEALARVSEGRSFFYEAEMHRLRGALLHQSRGKGAASEVEACLRKALDLARGQAAASLELRAAVGLARIASGKRRPGEARGLLAEIYGGFDEGRETLDLREAGAILEGAGPAA